MSMIRSRWYVSSPTADFDDRGIESLTALVGDSVARVADGLEPDAEDKVVLRNALQALQDQAEMFEFIANRTAAALPTMAIQGADALVDLIWAATDQLGDQRLLPPRTRDGLQIVISALRAIESGDHDEARRFDPLFERVAVLAEEGVGDIYSSLPGQI